MEPGIVVASIMGSASSSGAAASGVYTAVGLGVGGIFVAVALVVQLGYLDLLGAADIDPSVDRRIRSMLLAVVIPLMVTFGGVVLFKSFQTLGVALPG